MAAELLLMQALFELRAARAARALERLEALRASFPRAHVAPEAMFWEGVAAYRRSGNKDDLWAVLRRLVAAYPDSLWAVKTTLA